MSLTMHSYRTFLCCCALLVLAMAGCSPTKPPHKKMPVTPVALETHSYMRNLSLAHMAYDLQPGDVQAAKPYVDKAVAAMPKQPSATPRTSTATVLMLTYMLDDQKDEHTLMAPVVPLADGSYNFDALRQVTVALAPHKPAYAHIISRTVTVAEPAPLAKKNDIRDVRSTLDENYSAIAATAQKVNGYDAAVLQLALSRFYMQQKIRDAAYITLENSKIRLADADVSTPEDAKKVERLASESSIHENMLHKKMPYKF